MSTQTHTPGPWQFHTDRYDNHTVRIPCHASEGDPSTVMVHLGFTGECQANARLIAAAPELLEALKFAKRTLTAAGDETGIPYSDTIRAIDCAIAKAEGQPSEPVTT